ncbi:hypothetical protein H0H92_009510 [Tricholoma furcatifolium]|nr:hypothetical protein H0H92_009510 [Tricholoma furcatifolium]
MSDPQILEWTSTSSLGSRGGSIRWQAPELFDDETYTLVKNNEKSDIYAWACVCYEIFTGNVPFAEISRDFTIERHIINGVRPRRPSNGDLPWREWGLTVSIWTLMEKCWEHNPGDRPKLDDIVLRLTAMSSLRLESPARLSSNLLSPRLFRQKASGSLDPASAYKTLDEIVLSSEFNAILAAINPISGQSTQVMLNMKERKDDASGIGNPVLTLLAPPCSSISVDSTSSELDESLRSYPSVDTKNSGDEAQQLQSAHYLSGGASSIPENISSPSSETSFSYQAKALYSCKYINYCYFKFTDFLNFEFRYCIRRERSILR